MLAFSLTLPATRAAVLYLHPSIAGFGRPVVAAVLAAILLIVTRQRPPERRYWKNFAIVTASVVLGVPLLFAWGLRTVPAAHGAITLAVLPLATALAGTLRAGERPSKRFWIASLLGSVAVIAYALSTGAGSIRPGDIFLLLSVIASAIGYAEGAQLTRVFAGWQVTSWSVVAGAPFLVVPFALALRKHGFHAPPSALCGFAYICTISHLAGLFAWYKGLAAGGIARVGQLQLLQPFCTFLFSALLLGESVTLGMVAAAGAVVACIAISRNARIVRRRESAADSAQV